MSYKAADMVNAVPANSLSSGEALQLFLSNIEERFLLIDRDLRVILTNEETKNKVFEVLGKRITEGMSIMELIPVERQGYLAQVYEEVFAGETKTTVLKLSLHGEPVYFENIFKPARNAAGEVIAVLVSARNITEKKHAEEALRFLEERWRFALEGSNQGVWDWDMVTDETFISESFRRLYNLGAQYTLSRFRDWEQMIHPQDRKLVEEAIEKHSNSTHPYYDITYRVITSDNGVRWIMARGMIVSRDADGKPLRMIGTHTDITDQIQAKENYKLLFYSHPIAMFTYDLETLKVLEANDAALRLYGFSKEEFIGLTLDAIYPFENITEFRGNIQALKPGQKNHSLTLRNTRKNGEVFHAEIFGNELGDVNGKVTRLVSVTDITERVHAEDELRKSNERFSLAAKAASEALWEWDVQTGEVFMSDVYTDILGWKVNENRRFDEWHDLIHPDEQHQTITSFYEAIENPLVDRWEREYRLAKSDGTYAVVNDKSIILRGADGLALKVVGAMQDITEQKAAEEEIQKSNERFLLAARATSDAIYDWNIPSHTIHWGEGMQTLFGYHPKEITMERWEDLVHPEDRERVVSSLYEAIAHNRKRFWKEEYRLKKKDGTYSYVLDRGFFVRDEDGGAMRMIGSIQDFSERRYHEQLLTLERTIFELSANPGTELKTIADTLLKGIEDLHPAAITSLILLNNDGTSHLLAAPSLPAVLASVFQNKVQDAGDTSCGAAMHHKKTIITVDTFTNPLWEGYRPLVQQAGIRSCWSFPIIHSSGKVLGCFSIYHHEGKAPTSGDLATAERIRNILRIIIENRWSLQEIKTTNERFDIMMKATNDLIWDWDLVNDQIFRDPEGVRKVYGLENASSIAEPSQWLWRIHPDDVVHLQKVITSVIREKGQDTFEVEYRFKRDDDSYAWVYDRGIVVYDQRGKPVRMIGAAQDISERKRLERELLQAELEHHKAINQATIDSQEQERSEIGKELHDNVNQVLTTTKLYLDLAIGNADLRDDLLAKSRKNIIDIINEIRQLSRSLMDPSIGDLGLVDSIEDLIENINLARQLAVTLHANKNIDAVLHKNQKLTVFRIVQEALNNALKHSHATNAVVTLINAKTYIKLSVKDNGDGFDLDSIKKGAGLKNIQNRAYLVGGNSIIKSAPGQGCEIIITFPIENITNKYSA